MQADTGLVYSSPNWRENLRLFNRIVDNKKKLALEPYPDEEVLVSFARLAYSEYMGELDLPKGWTLLTTAQNKLQNIGYSGSAFWNPSEQQVVIAHMGLDFKNVGVVWTFCKGVYFNKFTSLISSAVTFADDIKEAILKINKQQHTHLVLSFSGHSLGGWLAGVTTLTVKYLKREGSGFCKIARPDEGFHAHTLAFDSPGVKDMLLKICSDYENEFDPTMYIDHLDITTFFIAPNLVNTTGLHVGDLHQIHTKRIAPPGDSKEMFNIKTHSIKTFIEAFKDGKEEIYMVQNWPKGWRELKYYRDLEMVSKSSILEWGNNQDTLAGTTVSQQDTQPVEGNTSSVPEEEIPTIPYQTIQSLGNTCQLRAFSAEELKFIQLIRSFQTNDLIHLTEIENIQSQQGIEILNYPKFRVDTRRNIIVCGSKEDLVKVIRQTKQLFRWFSADIMGLWTYRIVSLTLTTKDLVKVIRQTKQLFRWFSADIMGAMDKQNSLADTYNQSI